jgi:leader peptidase (prepilin peptidase) / N-methyltransferase
MLAGRAGRKTMIPFGPFMLAGAWLAIVIAAPVASWYLGAFGV